MRRTTDILPADFETVALPIIPCNNETKRIYPNSKSSNEAWLHRAFSKSDVNLDNSESNTVDDVTDDVKLTQFFNLYDKDGSGTVSYEELKAALKLESEGEFTDEDFRYLMDESDTDRNRSLDLAEFRQLIVKFRKMQQEKSASQLPSDTRMQLKSKKITRHHLLCNGVVLKLLSWPLGSDILFVVTSHMDALAFCIPSMQHPGYYIHGYFHATSWILYPWIFSKP